MSNTSSSSINGSGVNVFMYVLYILYYVPGLPVGSCGTTLNPFNFIHIISFHNLSALAQVYNSISTQDQYLTTSSMLSSKMCRICVIATLIVCSVTDVAPQITRSLQVGVEVDHNVGVGIGDGNETGESISPDQSTAQNTDERLRFLTQENSGTHCC